MMTERGKMLRIVRDKNLLSIWEVCHHMAAFLTVRTVGKIRLEWTIHNKDMCPVEVKDHNNIVVFTDIGNDRDQVDWCLEYDAPFKQYTLFKNSNPRLTCSKESHNFMLTFLRLCVSMVARCSTRDMSPQDLTFIGQQAVQKYEQYMNVMRYFPIPIQQIIALLTHLLGCVGTLDITITWSHFRVQFKICPMNIRSIHLSNRVLGSYQSLVPINKSWDCSSIEDTYQCYQDLQQIVTEDPLYIHNLKFVEKCIEGLNQNFKFLQVANKIHSDDQSSSSNEPSSLVSQEVQFFNHKDVELEQEEKSPSSHSVTDIKVAKDDSSDTEVEDFDDNQQQQEPVLPEPNIQNDQVIEQEPRLNNEEQVLPEPSIQNDQVLQELPKEQVLTEANVPNDQAMEQEHMLNNEEPVPQESPKEPVLPEPSIQNDQVIEQEPMLNNEEQVPQESLKESVLPEPSIQNDQAMEQMDRIKEMNKKRKRLLRSKGAPYTTLVLPDTNQETLANQDTLDKPMAIDDNDSDEAPLRTKRVKSKSVSVEKKRRRSARIQSHQTNDLDDNDWNETSLETNDKKEMDEWDDPKLNRLRRGLPIHYQSRHNRRRK